MKAGVVHVQPSRLGSHTGVHLEVCTLLFIPSVTSMDTEAHSAVKTLFSHVAGGVHARTGDFLTDRPTTIDGGIY